MGYLTGWIDPELKVREDDTPESITTEEVERLQRLLAVALMSTVIPRRLGADAESAELAADKRRAKRIAHVATQSLLAWGTNGTLFKGDVGTDAAQVVWERWWGGHRVFLLNRTKYIATWEYRTGTDPHFAKQAVTRLSNELHWLEYAMR